MRSQQGMEQYLKNSGGIIFLEFHSISKCEGRKVTYGQSLSIDLQSDPNQGVK